MKEEIFDFYIEDFDVGTHTTRYVDFPSFYGLQKVKAPIYVYRASEQISPCVVVTACIHGDEINGMRIAQKLIKSKLKLTKGTLIVLPVTNIYGFFNKVRYLPDRKDLNRCFPGAAKGSFGSRFAHFIMNNIVKYGDFYIDLHSGGVGRFNIPQIRCDLEVENTKEFIDEISIPLVINSKLRDGSLRSSLNDLKKPCIVFEGGEGLRIDEKINKYGLDLIKSILGHLEMIRRPKIKCCDNKIFIQKTRWYRAKEGGVFINKAKPGKLVRKDEVVGELRNITGDLINKIKMEKDGVIIGMGKSSVVMAGDALFNIGYFNLDDMEDEEDIYDLFDIEGEE